MIIASVTVVCFVAVVALTWYLAAGTSIDTRSLADYLVIYLPLGFGVLAGLSLRGDAAYAWAVLFPAAELVGLAPLYNGNGDDALVVVLFVLPTAGVVSVIAIVIGKGLRWVFRDL